MSSTKDARSWLENKGWLLNSEDNTNFKLADILFSASLAFKLPADACTAIRSVAFLLRAHADKTLSTTVSDLIIDKMIDKFSELLSRLNNSITATKMFLDAAAQKQAMGLLSLQESVKQQEGLAKSLATSAEKLNCSPNPLGLDDAAWPRLAANPPSSAPSSPTGGQAPRSNIMANPKVAQRVALAAKQLLIDYGPIDAGEEQYPSTIEAQRSLRQKFNGWIDSLNASDGGDDPPPPPAPSRAIRSVAIFDRPSILLEFNSPESKLMFTDLCNDNPQLLLEVGHKARIRPRAYSVIFRFVPCNGGFNPSDSTHLRNIERDNDLPNRSIISASWCKRPDRHAPNQATATLKVACSTPDSANQLLTGRIRVEDHLVDVRKDIRIPVRCVKCQGYGHIQDSCIGTERCANCASEFHIADTCDRAPACVSCGPDSRHPSTSPACPTFVSKCNALDGRFPENSMPYFPSTSPWTWAAAPTNPPPPETPLPPPQLASSRQRAVRPERQTSHHREESPHQAQAPPSSLPRQTDNGWPSQRRRQTTLTSAWGSQPKAPPPPFLVKCAP